MLKNSRSVPYGLKNREPTAFVPLRMEWNILLSRFKEHDKIEGDQSATRLRRTNTYIKGDWVITEYH